MARHRGAAVSFQPDAEWYKDAVIYEIHVKAFKDSDGDGIGDFRGLTESLDYLHDLGVDAIWLLPFYPSPLRDDGYDTADYMKIHPSYGAMRDFRSFLRAACQRGIHVITELVVNHTSDQHPWFQRARRAPSGSSQKSFYVWSDSPDAYQEARVIFQDFETSNWTWDPVARAYYWHRFYGHQPDLNYDNPRVRSSVFRFVDHWLNMGVSGLRLDAVPYLFEREGTNCENLEETHEFLRQLRAHIDEAFPNRMLLSEANQWPEDAVAYFGRGDECHMSFHFPLMPRLFMAVRMEDCSPVVDILDQTPAIPEACQWAIFLRNHDELTLEMVTDEERDYMYRMYAHDRQMRINLGIRRRLAPLLNNDRRKIELMNGLLFALPGTPVIYYGDEIGMGDNFFLGDRDGVRTPMQWNGDRNAGFSRANPHRLYLPVIIDPEYHYEAINVEAQLGNPDSLLWWMRRLISTRKRHTAFSRGAIKLLRPSNHRVLAFLRLHEDDTLLVVANLSRHPQQVFLNLEEYAGYRPIELFGSSPFPSITNDPYSLTIGSHSFFWFRLEAVLSELPEPVQAVSPDSGIVFDLGRGSWSKAFESGNAESLVPMLVGYLRKRRWFGGKARIIQSATIRDVVPIRYGPSVIHLLFVQLEYAEGEPETYLMPLSLAVGARMEEVLEEHATAVVARARVSQAQGGPDAVVYDAVADPEFGRALLSAIERRTRFGRARGARVVATRSRRFRNLRAGMDPAAIPAISGAEQSNTSLIFGERFILKLFRRIETGVNPDLEIGRHLTDRARYANTAPVAGYLEYSKGSRSEPSTVAILHGYVRNVGDAWRYTLDELGQYFENALARPDPSSIPRLPGGSLLDRAGAEPSSYVIEAIGPYLVSAELLGRRTGEMHLAFADHHDDPAFKPGRITRLYQRSLHQGMRIDLNRATRLLRTRLSEMDGSTRLLAEEVLDREPALQDLVGQLTKRRISGQLIRTHGDFHLGQVLYTGQDFVIIDFEGEPARPLTERRLKRTPVWDLAGMIRSFHYAVHAAIRAHSEVFTDPGQTTVLEGWGKFWYQWVTGAFFSGYGDAAGSSGLLPANREDLDLLLNAYLIDKAAYELRYELNNRPEWASIPLTGLRNLAPGE